MLEPTSNETKLWRKCLFISFHAQISSLFSQLDRKRAYDVIYFFSVLVGLLQHLHWSSPMANVTMNWAIVCLTANQKWTVSNGIEREVCSTKQILIDMYNISIYKDNLGRWFGMHNNMAVKGPVQVRSCLCTAGLRWIKAFGRPALSKSLPYFWRPKLV